MILLKIKFGGYVFLGISILIGLILIVGYTYDIITGNWRLGGKSIDIDSIPIVDHDVKAFRYKVKNALKDIVKRNKFKFIVEDGIIHYKRETKLIVDRLYQHVSPELCLKIVAKKEIIEVADVFKHKLEEYNIKISNCTIWLMQIFNCSDFNIIPVEIKKQKMIENAIKFIENRALPFFNKTNDLPFILKIIDNTTLNAKVFRLMPSPTWPFKEITIRRLCGDPKYEEKKMELLASCERAAKIEHGLYKNYPAAFKELCEILDKMEPRYSYHPERLGDVSEFVPKGPDEYPARRSFQLG